MAIDRMQREVIDEIDKMQREMIALSDRLYRNPELSFEEFQAMAWLAAELQKQGFEVGKGTAGLKTAFTAVYRSAREKPVICLMAEYDALPDLGHACGHNLSGVASITAAIALSKILSKNHFDGTILVMGTPGEELYSGKVSLIRAGAFQNVDVAMMVHMFDRNVSAPISLALDALDFHFRGKAAHAAGAPHEGINALNGVIQTFVGIDALRQHIRDDARIHGIITHGGVAPNIVPEKASARFYVRARARQYLDEVTEKVKNCARGAALATGAQVEIKNFESSVDDLISNRSLVEAFERNWSYFTPDIQKAGAFGSTDVGNVSHVVPTIQPLVSITPGIMPHTREFAEATAGEKGHRALAIGAKTLAITALDLFTNPELLGRIKEDFSQMPGR